MSKQLDFLYGHRHLGSRETSKPPENKGQKLFYLLAQINFAK